MNKVMSSGFGAALPLLLPLSEFLLVVEAGDLGGSAHLHLARAPAPRDRGRRDLVDRKPQDPARLTPSRMRGAVEGAAIAHPNRYGRRTKVWCLRFKAKGEPLRLGK